MKNMVLGGIVIILSITMMFILFRVISKNLNENMTITYTGGVIIGILTGILIFVIGVRQKLQGK